MTLVLRGAAALLATVLMLLVLAGAALSTEPGTRAKRVW